MREEKTVRRWSIRAHLLVLVVLVIMVGAAAGWYTERQTDSDGRRAAAAESRFAAGTAARELAQYVGLVKTSTANLAANPQINAILAKPAGCTLTFSGLAGRDRSHLDIVRADGTVVCSSAKQSVGKNYAAARWARKAPTAPVFDAPVLDSPTRSDVIVSSTPIAGGKGFVAAFVDLASLGRTLTGLYGGAHHDSILITTGNGSTVITRSLEPERWIGRPLARTSFARSQGKTIRVDLDGTRRIYGSATVTGTPWRLYAGESERAALAAGDRFQRRLLWIVLAGFAAIFVAAWLVGRRLIRPVRRLSQAVRVESEKAGAAPVPVCGPTELAELAIDVNGLIASVNRELAVRRLAEESQAASEQKYRLLFEGNPSPMWVFDTDTLEFLAVNEAAIRTYGYTRDEFLAMTIGSIRPSQDLDAVRADIAAGRQVARSWRHMRKDGTVFDVEITANDHEFEGRRARIVLAVDVSERVAAERALRKSEARYRDLFENASDLIATVDLDSRFTAVNDAFTRTLGYTSEELLGTPVSALVPEEDHALLGKARTDKLDLDRAGTVYTHDLIAKDGTRVPVEVASRTIVEDGQPVGIEAICRDVTERKSLEDQLRQAQRLEAVGRLAGGVAHDFNNLLTVICGYTEALMERGAVDGRRELAEVAAAADRATHLTRQLLAFSRRQVLKPDVVNVNQVVEGITPMLARLIGEDVDLIATLDPDAQCVVADPAQLEQVLVNLAVNARDAMPEGGKLTIETSTVFLDEDYISEHPEATSGPHTVLAVSDTGIGIDAETLKHVFEPFFTTKPAGAGTGLGLSTVYGIVKQSGGNIWLYSEPGQGTTFKVYLPAAIDQTPTVAVSTVRVSPTGTERILVVEDEAPLRALVADRLSSLGYTVFAPDSVEEALEVADREPIDLLLTDVVMPRISGRELAEAVCTRRPATRVLFMSGYTDEAVVRHGSLKPGAFFLEKPFSSSDLARRVREILDAEQSDTELPQRESSFA